MKTFTEPLKGLVGFEELNTLRYRHPGLYEASGCTDAQKPQFINALCLKDALSVIVTYDEIKARELTEGLGFFDKGARYFPAKDILFYQSDIRGKALAAERMSVFQAVSNGTCRTIVTTIDALMDKLAPAAVLKDAVVDIEVGGIMEMEAVRIRLVNMGYEYNYQAEEPGQFAVRGGILDVFPLASEFPYRVELWGDEVDSIRTFSPESQRSVENVESLSIYPATELVLSPKVKAEGLDRIKADGKRAYDAFKSRIRTEEAFHVKEAVETLFDQLEDVGDVSAAESFLPYFYDEMVNLVDYLEELTDIPVELFVDEPARCSEKADAVEIEFSESMQIRLEKGYIIPGQMKALYSASQTTGLLKANNALLLSAISMRANGLDAEKSFFFNVKSINSYNGSFELLVKDLQKYRKDKYSVILLCGSRTRAEHIAGELTDQGVTAFYRDSYDKPVMSGEVCVLYGNQKRGYEYPDIKFVVLTETDIFGVRKKRKRKKYNDGQKITSFSQLKPGDYVVHENHGLGIYRGIEKIEVDKALRDYMKIEYDKDGVLYVLATQLDALQKYSGAAEKPKINKLGGQEWARTKKRVQQSVELVAKDLVDLYAVRQNAKGFRYGEDTIWQKEFEEMFPFDETDDQLNAIEATKADMESDKIMDRLICGDVGFGKTEVALRAAFKAVQENKQVAYLVPTTILAQQHYNTFIQRMKDFPVNVELLCRFRTPTQQKESLKRLKNGMADVVIGTHRLLSKDVEFKDLGLLIVDEEQRFGVTHKEKIKQLKKNIDVLTLSATPIPRTLHMSMIGIRDMSVLEEPPQDRMPIQTYVMEYNDEMVREAITRELARHGQVYYVYNRVDHIASVAAKIQDMVPDADVAFAHGQMNERELESIMYQFINGDIDVLVSTTIIETGLDIGNVNTMIIQDADRLGLSQLYQLRGRIGRSNRTAFAFLMYKRNRMINEVAQKRLTAIREFTELGSGIKIAMKDLEIRGAGNVLGRQQHGHMEAVGYELYCKMLGEAVRTAKGETVKEVLESTVDIITDAYIPAEYIADEYQKLDIYKRIAAISTNDERDEMLDELIDRFGEPPKCVQNLLSVAIIKATASSLCITDIKQIGDTIKFSIYDKANLNPAGIPAVVNAFNGALSFIPDKKNPGFIYRRRKNSPDTFTIINEFFDIYRSSLWQEQSEE